MEIRGRIADRGLFDACDYADGSAMLTRSALAGLRLDELTDQHAQQFARQHSSLSPSGINRGLRTLRRALNLAFQWKSLDKPVKVTLAAGERQRDRVLNESEVKKYLDACPQPWKDCATIILDEGFRPSEVFALRWSHVFFNEDGTGLGQVMEGKSKAAHRMLPMTPRVYELLRSRHESCGHPSEGWIFPSSSECEHFNGDAAKDQHKKALTDSGVKVFVPYTLRHTAPDQSWGKSWWRCVRTCPNRWAQFDNGHATLHPSAGRRHQSRVCSVAIAGGHKTGHIQRNAEATAEQEVLAKYNVNARTHRDKLVPGVGVEPT